jgi:Fe-S cluster assembly protein SufD
LLKKRAIVDYYKIQNDNLTANLIDNTYVSQKQESSVAVNTFLWRKPTRNNLNFYHFGERIVVTERNYYWRSSTSTIMVQHATQIVKVIKITKESFLTVRQVFSTEKFTWKKNPKKRIPKNNNILLSDKATINAKPQLEILRMT